MSLSFDVVDCFHGTCFLPTAFVPRAFDRTHGNDDIEDSVIRFLQLVVRENRTLGNDNIKNSVIRFLQFFAVG